MWHGSSISLLQAFYIQPTSCSTSMWCCGNVCQTVSLYTYNWQNTDFYVECVGASQL